MTNDEIIRLDCRSKENRKKLVQELQGLKFFSELEKVNISDIEKAIVKLNDKTEIKISYIMPTVVDDTMHYSLMMLSDNGSWHTTVYAKTLYEGLAKVLLLVVNDIRSRRSR